MYEIRKIRDDNSLRHKDMSFEELKKEYDRSVKSFTEKIGKEVKIVSHPNIAN